MLEGESVQPLSQSLGVLLLGRPGDHAPVRVRQTYEGWDHLSSKFLAQKVANGWTHCLLLRWITVDKSGCNSPQCPTTTGRNDSKYLPLGSTPVREGRRTRFIGGATDLVVSLPEDLKTGSNSRSAPISLPRTVISRPNSSGLFAFTQELPRKSLATDRASDGWQAKPYRLDEIIRVGCSLQIGPGLFGHRLDYDDSSQGGRACETRNGRLGA